MLQPAVRPSSGWWYKNKITVKCAVSTSAWSINYGQVQADEVSIKYRFLYKSQHNLFCFVIYSSGLSCVVTFIKTCIVCIYKHKGCGTSKDEMSFSTIIDTVLATYKTTGNILSVGLDSSSMLDFVMDLYASSLIQLSVRLSYWPSPCSSDCCQSTQHT